MTQHDPARPIYQHPLAYLLGLHGVALMRAFAGEHDRDFVHARLEEIRRLLASADLLGDGLEVPPIPVQRGYASWALDYDGPNGFWGVEEPLVRPLMAGLSPGVAIDAACGTGRHSGWLVEEGHRVLGFDLSREMLAIAGTKVPAARFAEADFRSIPVADASADLMLNTLALAQVEDLEPVFAEAARVLKPGGHFVISDSRGHFVGSPLYPLVKGDGHGGFGYIPTWRHATSEYLAAALAHGFRVRHCSEPSRNLKTEPAELTGSDDPGRPPNIWKLMQCAGDGYRRGLCGQPDAHHLGFERE